MTTQPPIAVGLVGAGQWARTMHAPMHTAYMETRLAGVWSEHPERATALATEFNVRSFASFDELLGSCTAVDFAVPPAVQADLAPIAAAAGKALILEKPLGVSLAQARVVAEAVKHYGVPNIVVLTKRFHERTRQFLDNLPSPVLGIRGEYLHGGFLESGFLQADGRNGWRGEYGALYDLGPHLLDLIELAGGPVRAVCASGDPSRYLAITTEHDGGVVGHAALSGMVGLERARTTVDVFSSTGSASYTTAGMDHDRCWPVLRREFAEAVWNNAPVTVDVHRALRLQTIIEAVALSNRERRRVEVAEVSGSA